MKNIAVFASGTGSNFASILKEIKDSKIPAKICCVISDHPHPPVFNIAKKENIPTYWVNRKQFSTREAYANSLMSLLEDHAVSLIVLAGYLKLIPSVIVAKFRNSIMNIHPALLPNFGGKGYYGMRVHEAVIETGVKITGVTVHLVDEHYDTGPIVLQEPVQVLPDDTPETLAARVLQVEHKVYPLAVKAFCEGKLRVKGRKVFWEE